MKIWSYWEGAMHPVIDTCIKSMKRVCGTDFTLVTNHTLNQYVRPGTLCREFEILRQPARRAGNASDCVRGQTGHLADR